MALPWPTSNEVEPRTAAELLTPDEVRPIAAYLAKLRELRHDTTSTGTKLGGATRNFIACTAIGSSTI